MEKKILPQVLYAVKCFSSAQRPFSLSFADLFGLIFHIPPHGTTCSPMNVPQVLPDLYRILILPPSFFASSLLFAF